ncbi:hypothetical protein MLD38_015636 [Melastoma candidum]|uniref:Uncharacterized protein n=1 Tax=Melastoma candidum TaxID=119954 RepID=A0ACB9RGJ5_9MYRT|nr:hypothetical protein MLD38_015636 [Melastoma candidum]
MTSGGFGGSSGSPSPKILLAKPPGLVSDEVAAAQRPPRLPPAGSLNLLSSDTWDFHVDRFLPFLTENTDFTVVGVIGPTGAGKSTIMNHLYGHGHGMLPPFGVHSEDSRSTAKHCSNGIEPRVSSERLILLDSQPVFSPSVLAEIMRPDGSSTVPVLANESISAELAHEIMSIQLGVLLSSICHILLIVSEGVHDEAMWRLMLTVDLLKHGIPDPSSLFPAHFQTVSAALEKESKEKHLAREEYMAAPIFVHTKLHNQEINPQNILPLKKALLQNFRHSSFISRKIEESSLSLCQENPDRGVAFPNLFLIPSKASDESSSYLYESYLTMSSKLRDQVLSTSTPSFARTLSERDWLKNSAKIWEMVRNSSIIAEYGKTMQNSGIFRR